MHLYITNASIDSVWKYINILKDYENINLIQNHPADYLCLYNDTRVAYMKELDQA
jgi:hypothetical protein